MHNICNLRNTECHIIVYGDIVNCKAIWIQTASSIIACEVWPLNSIRVSGLLIIINVVWKRYTRKIDNHHIQSATEIHLKVQQTKHNGDLR